MEGEDAVVDAEEVAVGDPGLSSALAEAAADDLLEAEDLLLLAPDPLQAESDFTPSGPIPH